MINLSSRPVLAKRECCICRQNKTKKGGTGHEKLGKYITVDVAKSLQNAASIKREIYSHLETELVVMEISMIDAREYHCHESCRCILLKKPAENKGKERNLNIIEKGKNVKMNHIVEMQKNLVEQSGEEETGLKVQNERQ